MYKKGNIESYNKVISLIRKLKELEKKEKITIEDLAYYSDYAIEDNLYLGSIDYSRYIEDDSLGDSDYDGTEPDVEWEGLTGEEAHAGYWNTH